MPAISAMVLGEEEQFADLSASESEDEMMEGEELIDFDLDASLRPQGKLEVVDEENSGDSGSDSDDDWVHPKDPSRQVEPIDKKAHKAAVKEANRERRKEKMPKHEKKRKEKEGKVKK